MAILNQIVAMAHVLTTAHPPTMQISHQIPHHANFAQSAIASNAT